MDRYRLMLAILVTCCLCSCASTMIADHDLIIDKIPSKDMHIDYIYVDYDNGSTEISGTVRFNFRMIGTPSDHLVVTIIDRSGKEFYSASSDYYPIVVRYDWKTLNHHKSLFYTGSRQVLMALEQVIISIIRRKRNLIYNPEWAPILWSTWIVYQNDWSRATFCAQ
jgi:hypothetical protein